MHDDITAGAHWLIEQGIADASADVHRGLELRRLCGAHRRGEGAAAVPLCGRASLACPTSRSWRERTSASTAAVETVKESTGTDKALLQAESPVLHADRIKVPVLLVHGEEDFTVPVEQSQAMAKALTRSGREE